MTKKQKIVLAYLQGRTPLDLKGEKPEDLIPNFDEIKSFIIGLDAATLRQYMHDNPYAETFSERVSKALRDEAEQYLQNHPTARPGIKVSRITTNLGDDIQPSEVSRG